MKTRSEKIKMRLLTATMVITTMAFGFIFTTIRTNAISSESFEAGPTEVVCVDSLEDLVQLSE